MLSALLLDEGALDDGAPQTLEPPRVARVVPIGAAFEEQTLVFCDPGAQTWPSGLEGGAPRHRMTPLQQLVLESGLLEGRENALICAPAAASKSKLVLWIAMSHMVRRRRVIWIVPTRALAAETARALAAAAPREGLVIATPRPAGRGCESPERAARQHRAPSEGAAPYLDAKPETLAYGAWDVAICAPELLLAAAALNPRLFEQAGLLIVDELPAEAGEEDGEEIEAGEGTEGDSVILRIDLDSPGLVRAGGREVRLSPMSWQLLVALARRAGAVVERRRLYAQLWPGGGPEEQQLDAHRRVLCRELAGVMDGSGPAVEVLRRHGFRLNLPRESVRLEGGGEE